MQGIAVHDFWGACYVVPRVLVCVVDIVQQELACVEGLVGGAYRSGTVVGAVLQADIVEAVLPDPFEVAAAPVTADKEDFPVGAGEYAAYLLHVAVVV